MNIKSLKGKGGRIEFHFLYRDSWGDFDEIVEAVLSQPKVSLIEKHNAVYMRWCRLSLVGRPFEVVFHEDIGTYIYSLDGSKEGDDLARAIATAAAETKNSG